MKNVFTMTLAAALAVGLAACASKPKETAKIEPTPVEQPKETTTGAPTTATTSGGVPVVRGPAPGSLEDFRVNVGERVYFDLDNYRLDASDQEILKRQAAWLTSYPGNRVVVAGNCDERGTREYNLALGERRASIVKDYLVSLGVDGSRIDTISYGKERPIAGGSDDASWAQNRNGFTQIVTGATS
jgi:peptidoglycan-associated lipoprotein